ncbi:putative membrane protein [Inhella inkyongensis]|uniref:Putative membrane protein n=1 Tax=Inhella inkyongensis TaxID=392593 RepID=A0A840SA73_9BURK|nr:hypothetical protein [Inhella inkyongensis]MBB5206428.1 putative membrane protein [Inhella inkyongensis]
MVLGSFSKGLRRVALAFFVTGSAIAAPVMQVSRFDIAGVQSLDLRGINNQGLMVGEAKVAGQWQGFQVVNGSVRFLGGPAGALGTHAMGVSEAGAVVGNYWTSMRDDGLGNLIEGPAKGYVLENGQFTTLAYEGAEETSVRGISDNGRYLSGYSVLDFLRGETQAWVYDRQTGQFTDVMRGFGAIAAHVDDQGRVLGSTRYRDPVTGRLVGTSFTFDAGVLKLFNLDGQTDTRARAVNAGGQMAGFVRQAGVDRAFLGTPSDYQLYNWQGATGTHIQDINDAGVAVGYAFNEDGNGFSYQALIFRQGVPEPAALALSAVALLALRLTRRRTG